MLFVRLLNKKWLKAALLIFDSTIYCKHTANTITRKSAREIKKGCYALPLRFLGT